VWVEYVGAGGVVGVGGAVGVGGCGWSTWVWVEYVGVGGVRVWVEYVGGVCLDVCGVRAYVCSVWVGIVCEWCVCV